MNNNAADQARIDLPTAIMQLSTVVLGDTTSMDSVLQRATEVPNEVSVTMADGEPKTVASSGEFAVDVDERQYAANNGPCLDALRSGETTPVDDQLNETRWPTYAPGAVELGVDLSQNSHRKLRDVAQAVVEEMSKPN